MTKNTIYWVVVAILSFTGLVVADHNSAEPVVGTFDWHYSPANTVMREGHQKVREWRKQVQEEMLQRQGDKYFMAPPDSGDVIPAPPPLGTVHELAEGRLRAFWALNFVTNATSSGGYGSGVRLDRTVYDPATNKIYALTTEDNLVEGVLEQDGSWEQKNQVVKIAKRGFAGVTTPSGFRLIGSVGNVLHYSDDEGMTWVESARGNHDRGAIYWTDVMANGHILARVRKRVGNSTQEVMIRSTDYGLSYNDVQTWSTANGTVSTKLYNTDDYVVMIRPSGGSWEVWAYENQSFSQISSFTASQTPSTITGTFYDGGRHIYVGTSSGGYYTSDATNWEYRSGIQRSLETVHPEQPGFLFSRTPQHEYTTNGGQSWQTYQNNDNTIGWDPRHLTYYKVNGVWTFVAANDMGLCFNSDPLDRTTWQFSNERHTYAILHGGTAVDFRNLTVTANQDPGTFELIKTGGDTYDALNRQSADGLRIAAAANGASYWYRHYWDAFFHSYAEFTGNNARKASYNLPGSWYTPPFKGSTTPGEDAIYVTGQSNLLKLVYADGRITRTDLSYNFESQAGGITYGVGVTEADPNRIYVATRNGRFFHSTNAGQSWTETSYNGTSPNPNTSPEYNQSTGYIIEVSATDPDLVFWGGGSGSNAVLVSYDGGVNFTPRVSGLPSNERVGALSLSPDGGLAFSSNYYMYVASENYWYDLKTESMPSGGLPSAQGVNYLPLQRKVRYFTWGAGALDLSILYLNTQEHPAVVFEPTGCYQVTAAHSDKALQVSGGNVGDNVVQSTYTNEPHQKWAFQDVDGFFRVTNVGDESSLTVADGSQDDGANVNVSAWTGADEQLWNVVRAGEGAYAMVAKNSVKALDVQSSSTADGANVRQAFYFGNANQTWGITADPSCSVNDVVAGGAFDARMEIHRKPSSRMFELRFGNETRFDVKVFDMRGDLLHKASQTNIVDLSKAQNGVYYLKINAGKVHLTRKIVLN